MRVSFQEAEVGPFVVDLTTGRLLRDGIELGMRPQACRAFKTLFQNQGQFVDYEHMIAEAWVGVVVSRHTVDVTVGEVKKALREYSSWISHRPKVGYRLDVPKSDDLVRKGWHFWNRRTREGFEKALDSFQAAALEDSTDFRVYEGLAASYLMLGTYSLRPPHEVYPRFLDAHDRAVALTEMTPELRLHRAHALHVLERDFARAETEFLRCEREKPALTKMYGFLAMLYVSLGRLEDALRVLAKGYKIDPLFPVLPAVEVSVHFFARDYASAIACGRKSIELHPYILIGRYYYAQALEFDGDLDDALREYDTACTMLPGLTWLQILQGVCLCKVGRKAEAAALLERIEQLRQREYVDAYYLALLYNTLGRRERAFVELERAVEEDSVAVNLLDVDPKVDAFRHDPRFAALRDRVFSRPSTCASPVNPSDSSRISLAPA
jgi:tetratricopeptide (TPR) repeat protein